MGTPLLLGAGGFSISPSPLGSIILNDTDPYSASLTTFNSGKWGSYVGAGAVSFATPNQINFSGGDNTVNNFLNYTALPLALDSFTLTYRFILASNGVSTGLHGIGLGSDGNASLRNFILVDMRSGNMDVYFFYTNNFYSNIGAGSVTYANGNEMEIVMTKTLMTYSFAIRNVTQNTAPITISKNFSLTYLSADEYMSPVSYIQVHHGSGNVTTTYFSLSSTEMTHATTFLGDSKTQGFYADLKANRFSDMWGAATGKSFTTLGGRGDKLAQFVLLNKLVSILRPSRLVLMAPFRNDIGSSSFDATAKANYASIVSNAQSVGSDVWHHNAMTETVLDQSAGNTYQSTTYPANRIIAQSGSWVAATDTVADGIHPKGGVGVGNSKIEANLLSYIS